MNIKLLVLFLKLSLISSSINADTCLCVQEFDKWKLTAARYPFTEPEFLKNCSTQECFRNYLYNFLSEENNLYSFARLCSDQFYFESEVKSENDITVDIGKLNFTDSAAAFRHYKLGKSFSHIIFSVLSENECERLFCNYLEILNRNMKNLFQNFDSLTAEDKKTLLCVFRDMNLMLLNSFNFNKKHLFKNYDFECYSISLTFDAKLFSGRNLYFFENFKDEKSVIDVMTIYSVLSAFIIHDKFNFQRTCFDEYSNEIKTIFQKSMSYTD